MALVQVRLVVMGLVLLALAVAAPAQAQTLTIRLTSVTTLTTQHDTAPKGKTNKGDTIEFKDLLVNKRAQFGKTKGKPVAWDAGIVRYASATKRTIQVIATFPGLGTIRYSGALVPRKNGNTVLRITGGTGGFKGARGTVTIGPGDSTSPNTYRVVVPGDRLDIHRGSVA